MEKTIFAYTSPVENFPAFINVSEIEPNEKGSQQFTITVRTACNSVPSQITIDRRTFDEMRKAFVKFVVISDVQVPEHSQPTTRLIK